MYLKSKKEILVLQYKIKELMKEINKFALLLKILKKIVVVYAP